MTYRFVINREASQPYDESDIRKLVELKLVSSDTLAWCEGMTAWQPAGQIPSLAALLPTAAAKTPGSVPPPIPGEPPQAPAVTSGIGAAPPPPGTSPAATPGIPPPLPGAAAQAQGLQHYALQFINFFFRPWNGRPSKVRAYVAADPRRAVPVAAGVLVVLFILFCWAISPFMPEENGRGSAASGQPSGTMPPPPGVTMEQWRIMRDAQRQTDNTIEDVYRNNRDSFDRQSETYRRGTYDWYSGKD
jgi:hypothetical protein